MKVDEKDISVYSSLNLSPGMSCVYALASPVTHDIRYVGITVNPKERFRKHLTEDSGTHKCNWVKGLKKDNLAPLPACLFVCRREDAPRLERWVIRWLKRGSLVNLTDGGEGIPNPGRDTRLKLSASKAGKPGANKGRVYPPEIRERMGAGHRGKHQTKCRSGQHCVALSHSLRRSYKAVPQEKCREGALRSTHVRWHLKRGVVRSSCPLCDVEAACRTEAT